MLCLRFKHFRYTGPRRDDAVAAQVADLPAAGEGVRDGTPFDYLPAA
jgi:hypothetical protein